LAAAASVEDFALIAGVIALLLALTALLLTRLEKTRTKKK
jgi:hypothetical protein